MFAKHCTHIHILS